MHCHLVLSILADVLVFYLSVGCIVADLSVVVLRDLRILLLIDNEMDSVLFNKVLPIVGICIFILRFVTMFGYLVDSYLGLQVMVALRQMTG
jgi:hypothetical protein